MTKLCARGKSAAKRKFRVYPSAYANAYASKICAGKIKDPSGTKRKDWGPKKAKVGMAVTAGSQSATGRLQKSGLKKYKKEKPGGTKSGSTRPKNMTPKGHLVGDAYGNRGKMDYVPNKRYMIGGLITAGIKYGFKQYKKAGGRKIIEIMKSGVRGAGKRSDARKDLAYGIRMHGGNKLSKREIHNLQKTLYKK